MPLNAAPIKGVYMLNLAKRAVVFVAMSFVGGFAAIVFLSWLSRGSAPNVDQAVAIANTYIIFTTFIFVAFTVVTAIVGYIMAQTYTDGAQARHNDAIEHIKECIAKDDEKAVKLLNHLLQCPAVQNELSKQVSNKVDEILKAKYADAQISGKSSTLEQLREILSKGSPEVKGVARKVYFRPPQSRNRDEDEN